MSSSKKKQNNSKANKELPANMGVYHSVFYSYDKPSSVSGNSQPSCSSKQGPSKVVEPNRRPEVYVDGGPVANYSGNRNNSAALYREGQIVRPGSSMGPHNDLKKQSFGVNQQYSPVSKANALCCNSSQGQRGDERNLHEVVNKTKRKKKRSKSNPVTNEKPPSQHAESTSSLRIISNLPAKNVRSNVCFEKDITTQALASKYNPFGEGKVIGVSEAMQKLAKLNSAMHFQRNDISLPTTSSGCSAAARTTSSLESFRKKLNARRKKSKTVNIPPADCKKDLSQAALIHRYNIAHSSKVRDLGVEPHNNHFRLDQRTGNDKTQLSQSGDRLKGTEPSQPGNFSRNRSETNLNSERHKSRAPHNMLALSPLSASKFTPPPVICFKSTSSCPAPESNAGSKQLVPDHDDCRHDASMEWEDIEDEKVLQNIKVLRECCQNNEELNQLVEDMDTNCLDVSEDSSVDCIIVLDTNILISHLKFVAELSEQEYKGIGSPVLVIPWMVLKELDAFKQGSNRFKKCNSALQSKARSAAHFINSCFSSHHPRVKGQSALEDKEHCIEIDVPDDSILNCCLQLEMKGKRVILLSNDVNFCNKAMATGIQSYGKEQINKALKLGNINFGDAQPRNSSHGARSMQTENEMKFDQIILKCEELLKEFLSKFIETEMKRVFKDWWIKVIFIKPPWSLLNSLKNLRKHWVAVFGFVMDKAGQKLIEDLIAAFEAGVPSGSSPSEAERVVQLAVSFCGAIISSNYQIMAEEYQKSFMSLMKVVTEYKMGDTEGDSRAQSLPENSAQVPQLPAFQSDKFTVFETFQFLWTLVNNFCGVVCDTFGLEHNMPYEKPDKFPSVEEVKGRVPEAFHLVSTIVACLSSILETPITHLSVELDMFSALLSIIQSVVPPEFLVNKAITCEKLLIFCSDDSTRVMLSNGIFQFREVQMILLKVMNGLG